MTETVTEQVTAGEEEYAEWVPARYQHETIRGARLPGWEDLNATVLAGDAGIGLQHARQVLTGRTGATLAVYRRIARCLCISLDELMRKIDRARELDVSRRSHK